MIEVKFEEGTLESGYLGRNGWTKLNAVSVTRSSSWRHDNLTDCVLIQPINTQGTGKGALYIPVEDIPALIEALKKAVAP